MKNLNNNKDFIPISSCRSSIIPHGVLFYFPSLSHFLKQSQKREAEGQQVGLWRLMTLIDATDGSCELHKSPPSQLSPHSQLHYVSSRYRRGFGQLTVRSVIVMLPGPPKHKSIPPYHRFKISLLILLKLFSRTQVNTDLETILLEEHWKHEAVYEAQRQMIRLLFNLFVEYKDKKLCLSDRTGETN